MHGSASAAPGASLELKVMAMTAGQSFGFIGGPIFPRSSPVVRGRCVHGIAPDMPLARTVTSGMAAVPAAVLPLPSPPAGAP